MTKDKWREHARTVGYFSLPAADRLTHAANCTECQARLKTKRSNQRRKDRDSFMRDLGMTKTRYGWE